MVRTHRVDSKKHTHRTLPAQQSAVRKENSYTREREEEARVLLSALMTVVLVGAAKMHDNKKVMGFPRLPNNAVLVP